MNLQPTITTVSNSNQTAVPSYVRRLWQIQSGDKLMWEIDPGKKIIKIKPSPSKWGSYMRGLGKQVWSGISAKRYVQKLRQDRDI